MSNDGSGTKEPYCTRKKRALEGSVYYTPILIIIIEWKVPFLELQVLQKRGFEFWVDIDSPEQAIFSFRRIPILLFNIPKVKSSLWVQTSFPPTQHSREASTSLGSAVVIGSAKWSSHLGCVSRVHELQIPRRWSSKLRCGDLTGGLKSWPLQFGTDSMEFEEDAKMDQNDYPPYTFGTGSELF